jgi:DNA-binding MarR family transcriptional regulator
MEQLWNAMSNHAINQGMKPAQWTALRYLAQANESACHVGAFAQFHRTTPSSASQTMTALEKRNLVVKRKGEDNRQRILALTAEGEQLLKDDPMLGLAATIATLSDEQLATMAEVMNTLLRTPIAPPKVDK